MDRIDKKNAVAITALVVLQCISRCMGGIASCQGENRCR